MDCYVYSLEPSRILHLEGCSECILNKRGASSWEVAILWDRWKKSREIRDREIHRELDEEKEGDKHRDFDVWNYWKCLNEV